MPLAIALAAAWMQMLTPAEIATEIERSMDILEADMRDAPARQRSMRATFDHSWSLLSAREQEVLAGLSVFRGGLTREAAEQVTGASLRELMALVNGSLLQRTPAGRYEVHELLRQYAAGRLAQSPDGGEQVRGRHCAYYAAALQRFGMELKGARQRAALEEIEAEGVNARVAWDWAAAHGWATPLGQMADGLGGFFEWQKRFDEGASAFGAASEALRAVSSADELRVLVKILIWQGFFAEQRGEIDNAQDLWQQSLAILDTPALQDLDTRPERASALDRLGWSMRHRGQREDKRLLEQSLEIYRAIGDRSGTAGALLDLGWVLAGLGEPREAQRLLQESVAIYHELGDRRTSGWAYLFWGFSAIGLGQVAEAERLAQASIADFEESGDPFSVRTVYHLLNGLLREDGRFAEAHALAEENLTFFRDIGEPQQVTHAMAHLCECKLHLGRYESVHELAQEYLALSQELGYRRHIGPACALAGQVALAQGAWSEAHERLQRGMLANEQVARHTDRCSDLAGLAHAAIGLGRLTEARQYLRKALGNPAEGKLPSERLAPVVAAAALLADEGQVERAVELYALASQYPLVSNSRWYEDVAGKHIAALAADLPREVVVAAQERGRARDLGATVKELRAELSALP
jgi:tetratricopeptide (TPR) repeat protein